MTIPNPTPDARRTLARLDRRTLFGLGGAALAGTVAAGTIGAGAASAAPCVPESSMPYQNEIDGIPLVYEPTKAAARFRFNTTFYGRLEAWHRDWSANAAEPRMTVLRSYGAYVNRNDGCTSLHNYGRGFDIASGWSGASRIFTARYDLWKGWTGTELTNVRREYWTAVASLSMYFEHTLTYLYNTAHHNHIHVDNAKNGAAMTTFSGGNIQSKNAQAILAYIWGKSVVIDGAFGAQSQQAAKEVLARIGVSGTVARGSTSTWQALLKASVRKGSGKQAY